jgi:hypothetical protein
VSYDYGDPYSPRSRAAFIYAQQFGQSDIDPDLGDGDLNSQLSRAEEWAEDAETRWLQRAGPEA